ncbi:hypothetical protein GYB61_00030 [bacterium]|nr:hypothetical protein [bacterium]
MKKLAVLWVAAALVACSDGDDVGSVTVGSTSLQVQVVDSNGAALSNIDVVLHGADELAVERIETTDASGVADFGNVGRSRVTITAGQMDGDLLELITHVAVQAGNRRIVFGAEEPAPTQRGTISANFSVQTNDEQAGLLPVGAEDSDLSDGQANFQSVAVSSADLAADNSLNLLAFTVDADGRLNQYGFLTDQAFADGANYTGTMDRQAADVPWSSNAPQDTSFLQVGLRGEVPLFLGASTGDGASGSSYRSMQAFPADRYVTLAITNPDDDAPLSFRVWVRDTAAPSSNLSINFADFTAADLVYDPDTTRYTWSIDGVAAFDGFSFARVVIDPDTDAVSAWSFRLPPDRRSLTLPELPSGYEAGTNRGGDQDAAVVVPTDFVAAQGYDAFTNMVDAADADLLAVGLDQHVVSDDFGQDAPPPAEEPEPDPGPGIPSIPELPLPGLPGI